MSDFKSVIATVAIQLDRAGNARACQGNHVLGIAAIDDKILYRYQRDARRSGRHKRTVNVDRIRAVRSVDRNQVTGRRSTAIDIDRGADTRQEIHSNTIVSFATFDIDRIREASRSWADGDIVLTAEGEKFERLDIGVCRPNTIGGHDGCAQRDHIRCIGQTQ